MKEILEDLLAKKKSRYIEDYSEMLGDFKRELETTEGYNGRQILELLQNCDDEGAKEVFIELNILNKTISISNDGSSFSEKGYRSLFIANLSSKTSKRKYIGNKGLGFRSVINWSNQIEIISNGISIKYSNGNLRKVYECIFSKEQRVKIADEEGLKEGVVPMPMLSVPEITELQGKADYSTTIILSFKENYLNDIIQQLNSLTSDILLFLRNIETVKFTGLEDKEDIKCLREVVKINNDKIDKHQRLFLNERIWDIYSIEEELPDELADDKKKEKDLYQISIAIEENMSYSLPYLFSFFPTNIMLNQPYVLHATFDLDATRNQINNTEKNKFILSKIVDFTIDVAKYLSMDVISYEPLKILFHKHKADTLSKFDYYTLINNAIREQELFPCVDNTYRKLEDVLYVSNEMAKLLIEIGGEDLIDCHLIPTKDEIIEQLLEDYQVDKRLALLQDYTEVINSLGRLDINSSQRARLIKIVAENFKGEQGVSKRFNLLIDNNSKIIDSENDIYTPPTNEIDLKRPSFARIVFIKNELYESILQCYKKEDYEKRGKSRFVYDLLSDYCNIHSFEPIALAEKIIRATNEELDKAELFERKLALVQEMNQCLYENYTKQSDKSKLTIDNVPSISKTGSIVKISDVHLSEYYPSGKNVELLFYNIYNDDDYTASPQILGFTIEESIENIESFLLWLGANRFFKFISESQKEYFGYGNSLNVYPYLHYTKEYRNDNDNYTGFDVKYLDIEGEKTIFKNLDIHNLIVLASVDNVFRKQLNNQDQKDIIKLFYRYEIPISNTPSYIKFLVTSQYGTDGFLLDERFSWVNDYEIDYNHSLFKKFNLNKIRVKEILLNLGAVETINKLTIAKLTRAFGKLNKQFPDGTGSQQFYKKALAHYDEHKQRLNQKVKLFARESKKLTLFDQDQIYFSDNNFLPSSLSSTYPLFNFPLRAGAKKAIEFFGINDLSLLRVNLLKSETNHTWQNAFTEFFNGIKPYLLAYRLENIERSEVKDDQVVRLNNLKFKFCKEVHCRIQNDVFPLSEYNYIYNPDEKIYYIKVSAENEFDSLRKNPLFVDNFSEILLNAFATSSEKAHFESLLRDDEATIDYNIRKFLGDNVLEEARILLGLVSSEKVFWKIIFQLNNEEYPGGDNQLEDRIRELLNGMEFNINYEDLNSESNKRALAELFNKLNITVIDFNKLSAAKISTYQYNVKQLQNNLNGIESKVKQRIWNHLNEVKEKRKFLIKYFNTIDLIKNSYEEQREMLDSDFLSDFSSINLSLLSEHFDFTDWNQAAGDFNYWRLYRKNRNQFNNNDIIKIEDNPEIKSLLYFNDLEPIKSYLEALDKSQDTEDVSVISNVENPTSAVIYNGNMRTCARGTEMLRSSIYKPSRKSETQLKILGNKIEDLAYNTLVKSYGEVYVNHKSKETEWEHYDIKYSKDEGKNWTYVEVKSAPTNKFIMSFWERKFGKDHSDCYEIWVFKNESFTVLTNFFAHNPIFNPTEFEVILEES